MQVVQLVLIIAAAVCATAWGMERWFDLRRAYHQRRGDSAFAVVPRPALPHEDDGPGTYDVTGVLERLGTPTRFKVEATDVRDAWRQSVERGVSPAAVTKQRPRSA